MEAVQERRDRSKEGKIKGGGSVPYIRGFSQRYRPKGLEGKVSGWRPARGYASAYHQGPDSAHLWSVSSPYSHSIPYINRTTLLITGVLGQKGCREALVQEFGPGCENIKVRFFDWESDVV